MFQIKTSSIIEARKVIDAMKKHIESHREVSEKINLHKQALNNIILDLDGKKEEEIYERYIKGEVFLVISPKSYPFLTYLYKSKSKFPIEDIKLIEEEDFETLSEKYTLRIKKVNVSFKDVVGMRKLKEEVEKLEKVIGKVPLKGIFLVGVPGTGKTFVAKAIASKLKALYVELDIKEFLGDIERLHKAFSLLEKISEKKKVVVLMDELDKAFYELKGNEGRFLGSLMTILNDLNEEGGYKINGVLIATANNIVKIAEREPAFFRKGRWDYMYFVDLINKEDAIKLGKILTQKFSLPFKDEDIRKIIDKINEEYLSLITEKINMEKDFVFTPAEVTTLFRMLKIKHLSEGKIRVLDIERAIKDIKPIYLTLQKEILAIKSLEDMMVKL